MLLFILRTVSLSKRPLGIWAFVACAVAACAANVSAQTATIKDLRGRSVTVPAPAKRILIDDGRYLIALALIHPNPVSVLSAWPRDINRIGDKTYEQFRTRFPEIEKVAQVAASAGTFSLERAIAVRPDVAVFTLGLGPTAEQISQLEAAGIPVVFIDFFSQPFENLEPSLKILGQLTGRSQQAQAFIDFRKTRFDAIASAIKKNVNLQRPKVFLEAHAGMTGDCCNSPGKGNVGDYIELVGGHNIGADVLPGTFGRLNLEYVVSQNPSVYIATGGPHLEKAGGMVLGQGYSADRALTALKAVSARPGISTLPAVKTGQAHGLSHQLLNSPLDILAVEVLAKWIQPKLFASIDANRTLTEINTRFLAVPLEGVYWIDWK